MNNKAFIFGIFISLYLLGCSGMKVIDPNKPNNQGTRQLEIKDGSLHLAETFTCTMVAGNGKRVYAVKKTENEARQEAIAQCRDQTLVSVCRPETVKCEKN